MVSIKMITFCKTKNCPAPSELLEFQSDNYCLGKNEFIRAHLKVCEFCAAEVEFYSNYPQAEETVVTVEIPIPLFELATALLRNEHQDFSLLNKLLYENEIVKVCG